MCFQISTVIHSEGMMQIIVENVNLHKKSVYSVKHKRRVISLKFSVDQKILAIQHDENSVVNIKFKFYVLVRFDFCNLVLFQEFMSFDNGVQLSSFTQYSKATNSKLLGFVWVSGIEVLFVTNMSMELYQVYI